MRALAKIHPRPARCIRGNIPAGRVVSRRHFAALHAQYWWPRRKEYEESELGRRRQELSEMEERWNFPTDTKATDFLRTIYILGSGNIGKLVAHSLASISHRPPITLFLHHQSLVEEWKKQGECLRIERGSIQDIREGFQVEFNPMVPIDQGARLDAMARSGSVMDSLELEEEVKIHEELSGASGASMKGSLNVIYNLIVTVKGYSTVRALRSVAHRLTKDSTILFLQNGMGMLDEVNLKIFPDVETRPTYMIGVTTHGVHQLKTFTIVHAGTGTIAISVLPRYSVRDSDLSPQENNTRNAWGPSTDYLLRTMTRTPVLAAVGFAPIDLMQLQIEKLAVNAIINPLTVMLDCINGEILYNMAITRVYRLLLSEISFVIRSLPELQNIPNVEMRFSTHRLEMMVVSIATNTFNNTSSMLADIRAGKETEVDYINGYIVRRGEELGFKCVMNYMVQQMVKGKQQMLYRRDAGYMPLEGPREQQKQYGSIYPGAGHTVASE